jgi:hypothetical protein
VEGNLTYIILKKRNGEIYETVIDTKNLLDVMKYDVSWYLQWDSYTKSYYCKANIFKEVVDGKKKYTGIYLHRIIMKPPKGKVVNHKDHDTLNNREENLENRTRKGNCLDRRGANPNNNSTGHRNVTWSKQEQKYVVQLYIEGKNNIMGKFINLQDAVECAEGNRKKYYEKVF